MKEIIELQMAVDNLKIQILKALKIEKIVRLLNKEYIDVCLRLYSCDVYKNKECLKTNCAICKKDRYGCTNTTQYKYAKKTPLNFIKKIINKIRGVYKYDE